MPATEDGTNRLLDFFVYGMLRAAESLGNAPLFLRTVVEQGLREFMLVHLPTFRESDNATEACDAFTKAAEASGLFDRSDSVFRSDADTLHAEYGDQSPYHPDYTDHHDEPHTNPCLRPVM